MSDVPLITGTSSLDLLTEAGLSATAPITSGNRPFFWQQIERIRAALAICDTVAAIKHARVTLDDAQIKALPTTGVTIVPAAGANTFIKVIGVTYTSNFTAGIYTNLNATYVDISLFLDTYYASYGFVKDSTTTPQITAITDVLASASIRIFEVGQPNLVAITGAPGYAVNVNPTTSSTFNKPLIVKADNSGSGNFTGGNAANTLRVDVLYMVL